MSFAASFRYGTPLGLIANTPDFRSSEDTLPNVPITSPLSASARFARHAISFSSDARNGLLLLQRQKTFHDRSEIRASGCDAARLRRRSGGQPEGIVELAINPVEHVVRRPRVRVRRERFLLHARHALLRFLPPRIAAR